MGELVRPNVSRKWLRPFDQGGKQKKFLVTAIDNAKQLAQETGRPLDKKFVLAAIASSKFVKAHPSLGCEIEGLPH